MSSARTKIESSSFIDPIVEVGEDREETIDQAIDDPVEQKRRVLDRLRPLCVPLADLGEGATIVAVDGDEEPLGVETVHLDETILVRRTSVDDEEDEVVVVLDFARWPKCSESSTASG